MKLVKGITLAACFLLATGCGASRSDLSNADSEPASGGTLTRATKEGSGAISTVYSTDNCTAITRGGFVWITDRVVLADLLSPLSTVEVDAALSKIDFATQGALMVDFGTVPTPDYKIRLKTDQLQLDGPKAIIQLDLVKPKAAGGTRRVQVVRHPCVIYVMPRVGYSLLEVQSELGDVFTSFDN